MKIAVIRSTSIYKDSRTTKLVKELLDLGHEVIVFGWDRLNEYSGECFLEFDDKKAKIIFFDKYCEYGGGIKNIFKSLAFQKWVKKQVKNLSMDWCLHCCDFDTAKPAWKVHKKRKFIYDIFDYFSESRNLPKILKSFIERSENKIINKADAVILCTEQRLEQISKCTPKKIVIIHNTPNISIMENKEPDSHSQSDKIKVVYVGVLAENRLLKEILDDSQKHKGIELHIGGIGKYSNDFAEASKSSENITYYGSLNYDKVLELESKCDVLFATYDPSIPNHRYSAPNKFYEAGALSKPIIVCKNTGVDRLVEENNCGLIIEYSSKYFYEAVNKLSKDKILAEEIGKNGNKAYNEKFSWKIMQERIKELYEYIGDIK